MKESNVVVLDGLVRFRVRDSRPCIIWEKFKGLTEREEYFLSQIHSEDNDIDDLLLGNGLELAWNEDLFIITIDSIKKFIDEPKDGINFTISLLVGEIPTIRSIYYVKVRGKVKQGFLMPSPSHKESINSLCLFVEYLFGDLIRSRKDAALFEDEFICSKRGREFFDSIIKDIERELENDRDKKST